MLVMGLGNPGPAYADTRHNVGYRTVDAMMAEPPLTFRGRLFSSALTARSAGADRDIIYIRYAGFMNSSGLILPSLLRRYRAAVTDLVIVVDNMDLPPGSLRLRKGGGHAGHNGLKSIIGSLGNGDFIRLYVGVGRPENGNTVVDHVLGAPGGEDSRQIDAACRRGADALLRLSTGHFDRLSEEINRRES